MRLGKLFFETWKSNAHNYLGIGKMVRLELRINPLKYRDFYMNSPACLSLTIERLVSPPGMARLWRSYDLGLKWVTVQLDIYRLMTLKKQLE